MATTKIFRTSSMKLFSNALRHDTCFARNIHIHKCLMSNNSALSVVCTKFGDPNTVLKIQEVELPEKLKKNEVLVKMLMAPCNPADINMIEGSYGMTKTLPAVVGSEGVGEILKVGDDVKSLCSGDWVIPSGMPFGTWTTHAIVNETDLRKIRNDIPALSAATINVNPTTAYRMLKDFGNLGPGDWVIQNSSNSGVGLSVIQIAKAWGIKTINIVRDRENLSELVDYLKSLGATHVVTEEFCRTPAMKDLMKSLDSPPKLALNGVGGKSSTELLRHLGNKGVMVTYGGMSKKPVTVPTGVFIFKEVTALGFWCGKWMLDNEGSQELKQMFEDLGQMVKDGKLLPPPCEFFELERYADVVKGAMDPGFKGKKQVINLAKL